jgi:tricarballylate dehydrogenase
MIAISTAVEVLVIGGGNAGLNAAIAAARAGRRVLVLECAPEAFRGGNSRHTRDIRFAHNGHNRYVTGPYAEDEFWTDLQRVTNGATTEALARLTISQSADIADWGLANGVRWQLPLRGTLHLARTNIFMLGGGKAMINAYYAMAQQLGVEVRYDTEACDLIVRNGAFEAAAVERDGRRQTIPAKAVVVAAGGFEANLPWLKAYWGDAADNFVVRGTPYNQGRMLAALLDLGAASVASEREFHAVAVDARAPHFDGGIVTRLDSAPFGIVVNRDGQRFYDEGEDFWPKRYAIWGGLIARQPGQIAYSILDAKAVGKFMPSLYPPFEAGSVGDLAERMGLPREPVETTVARYNRATRPGNHDPSILDDCATEGLDPPKSHWALPIDTPPFWGFPLRPGITFTYHGVMVNDRAQAIMRDGRPARNIFAAGEIMAGNILGKGYLAGFGLTIGTVFGRIAGKQAACHAGR